MTHRCSAASARPTSVPIEPNDCRPTAEERESHALASEHAAERDAEIARNRYFATHTDEGGRCLDASSDAGSYSPMLRDDPALKDSRRTAASDYALMPDPLGNAIASAIVGGVIAGVGAAAADALVSGAEAAPVIEHIGRNVAVKVAKSVVKQTVKATVREYFEDEAARAAASASPTSPATPPVPAGRTSPKAASEVVKEPNSSPVPIYTPLLVRG